MIFANNTKATNAVPAIESLLDADEGMSVPAPSTVSATIPPPSAADPTPPAIPKENDNSMRSRLMDESWNLQRGLDMFMGPSNSMIDFLSPGNRKAETANRVGEDMVQDFITIVRQYMEVPDMHTFIRDMMKVRKQIALMEEKRKRRRETLLSKERDQPWKRGMRRMETFLQGKHKQLDVFQYENKSVFREYIRTYG